MSEMVERVAKAIYEAGEKAPSGYYDYISEEMAEVAARAAIAAMREPTHEGRLAVWEMLERNAAVGNLKPGKIRGNGVPDVAMSLIVQAALMETAGAEAPAE